MVASGDLMRLSLLQNLSFRNCIYVLNCTFGETHMFISSYYTTATANKLHGMEAYSMDMDVVLHMYSFLCLIKTEMNKLLYG